MTRPTEIPRRKTHPDRPRRRLRLPLLGPALLVVITVQANAQARLARLTEPTRSGHGDRTDRGSHTTDVALWIGFVGVIAATVLVAFKAYIGTLLGKFT